MTEPTNPRADQLRAALSYWREGILEGQADNLTAPMLEDAKHFDAIMDAARDCLAVLEGPTDEMRQAAKEAIEAEMTPEMLREQRLVLTPEVMADVALQAALAQIGEPT